MIKRINKKAICLGCILVYLSTSALGQKVGLTLIPPDQVTDQINLDIRAGLINHNQQLLNCKVTFYLNQENSGHILYQTDISLAQKSAKCVRFNLPTRGKTGKNKVILVVNSGGHITRLAKEVEVISSQTRSTRTIGGAWISFYHWSDKEGKMWNPIIKNLSDDQWQEMIGSMHKIGMNVVVIQESFRNQEYVDKKDTDKQPYNGKAYYPSKLYPGRMPIKAKDPIEAVFTAADRLGMHVFAGVGMYAWFDYTPASLAWHKKVAKELWDRYGHHPSFYGFYVSEEGMGSLDCFEKDPAKQPMRRQQVLDFFKSFTPFVHQFAPDKPVMFAPNGWGVGRAGNAYAELLKHVDIITPFAFARMPEGDLSGPEAIRRLQQFCDNAHSHLWLDLEAFLFNEKEGYLYPRPISGIKSDLNLFNSFEKVICYQYPGVFNDPKTSVRVGEPSTVDLYRDYENYLHEVKP